MNPLTPEEQQRIEQLELQIAWIKEKFPLQYYHETEKQWIDSAVKNPWDCNWIYRRKPTKKVVPLEASDIDLHRDLFKKKDSEWITTASAITATYLYLSLERENVTYQSLSVFYIRSTDGGKTWLPCSKEVEG